MKLIRAKKEFILNAINQYPPEPTLNNYIIICQFLQEEKLEEIMRDLCK